VFRGTAIFKLEELKDGQAVLWFWLKIGKLQVERLQKRDLLKSLGSPNPVTI
jgi:hypothetical protein